MSDDHDLDDRDNAIDCPLCGHNMVRGSLRSPGNERIYVSLPEGVVMEHLELVPEDERSSFPGDLLLDAWVCRHCGHVSLHTRTPVPDNAHDARSHDARAHGERGTPETPHPS